MPLVLSPFSALGLAIILVVAFILAIRKAWRNGRASYLEDLRKKHFEEKGVTLSVLYVLLNISKEIGRAYYKRDEIFAEMERCFKTGEKHGITILASDLRAINQKIESLGEKRHEAEATAKLLGHGEIADEVHASGFPTPEKLVDISS